MLTEKDAAVRGAIIAELKKSGGLTSPVMLMAWLSEDGFDPGEVVAWIWQLVEDKVLACNPEGNIVLVAENEVSHG